MLIKRTTLPYFNRAIYEPVSLFWIRFESVPGVAANTNNKYNLDKAKLPRVTGSTSENFGKSVVCILNFFHLSLLEWLIYTISSLFYSTRCKIHTSKGLPFFNFSNIYLKFTRIPWTMDRLTLYTLPTQTEQTKKKLRPSPILPLLSESKVTLSNGRRQ